MNYFLFRCNMEQRNKLKTNKCLSWRWNLSNFKWKASKNIYQMINYKHWVNGFVEHNQRNVFNCNYIYIHTYIHLNIICPFNQFLVYHLVALITFTVLCNHHLSISEIYHHRKQKLSTIKQQLPILPGTVMFRDSKT